MITGETLYAALKERARWNVPPETLVEEAVTQGEGELASSGALAVMTGKYTGRSPGDKFTVRHPQSGEHVDWNGEFNQSMEAEPAERLAERILTHAKTLPRLYGFQGFIGRGPHRLSVALISEFAWHSLMGRHMYVRADADELAQHKPDFTLLYTPSFDCIPERDGTHSEAVILADLDRQYGVIAGTRYGGEEKKFFFYVLNYLLPLQNVLPMHCSANKGTAGDVSVIFGLSGTGKTTLSADPDRLLIGDDEHGWDENGIFNFEGGCYAKLIRLSQEHEPLIWNAIHRPRAILENVPLQDGAPDFNDATIENTRGVYPLDALDNVEASGVGDHPSTIVFLTFDATGTLPPVSILDENQALYWFLAGYTAKVAGTERGLTAPAVPTFSACFGAPFLPWHPNKYVELMRSYLRRHKPLVILMNTGSLGGPYGEGGERPPIPATRAMLAGAQSGALRNAALEPHPFYRVGVPRKCPGVEARLLNPKHGYAGGDAAYDRACRDLVVAFRKNVNDVYAGTVARDILDAGPVEA